MEKSLGNRTCADVWGELRFLAVVCVIDGCLDLAIADALTLTVSIESFRSSVVINDLALVRVLVRVLLKLVLSVVVEVNEVRW